MLRSNLNVLLIIVVAVLTLNGCPQPAGWTTIYMSQNLIEVDAVAPTTIGRRYTRAVLLELAPGATSPLTAKHELDEKIVRMVEEQSVPAPDGLDSQFSFNRPVQMDRLYLALYGIRINGGPGERLFEMIDLTDAANGNTAKSLFGEQVNLKQVKENVF